MANGKAEYNKATKEAQKDKADLVAVLALLERAIELGSHDAQYALATWYLFGKGVKRDYTKAVKLLRKCANSVANASYDLAVCYEKGKGVEQDKATAFQYYMQSALLGDNQAYFEVGRCFFYGIGVKKNRSLGGLWIEKAKVLGYDDSQHSRSRVKTSTGSR